MTHAILDRIADEIHEWMVEQGGAPGREAKEEAEDRIAAKYGMEIYYRGQSVEPGETRKVLYVRRLRVAEEEAQ